jgi:hypothetical protein
MMHCSKIGRLAMAVSMAAFAALVPVSAPASEHGAAPKQAAEAPAHGSGHGSGHGAAHAAASDVQRIDVLDLGEFKIRNTLTAHHQTVDIRFALHLILSSTTTPADFERLLTWQNRFRDQAIVAVRSADPADFADPQLKRLRRLILLRVCRLPAPAKIIGVYLTDFAVDKVE